MRVLGFIVFLFAAVLRAGPAAADALDRIVTWPAPPAVLKTGAVVKVEFHYRVEDPRGARIFVVPLSGGQPADGYAVSGSPLYHGTGRGSATLTLRGRGGEIDAIQLQVKSIDGAVRARQVVRATFRFAEDPLAASETATMAPLAPRARNLGRTERNAPAARTIPGLQARPLVPRDALRSLLGRDLLFQPTPRVEDLLNQPDGGGETVLYQTLMSPPQPYEEAGIGPEWVEHLNNWLGLMSTMMLFDIQRLIGEEAAFSQYQADEAAEADTLYETFQYRRHTIGRLLDEL